MEYLVAVFRSRSQTMTFYNLLSSYKVPCSIINTPRCLNISCGISVRFSLADSSIAEQILSRRGFSTFGGIYKVKQIGNNIIKV